MLEWDDAVTNRFGWSATTAAADNSLWGYNPWWSGLNNFSRVKSDTDNVAHCLVFQGAAKNDNNLCSIACSMMVVNEKNGICGTTKQGLENIARHLKHDFRTQPGIGICVDILKIFGIDSELVSLRSEEVFLHVGPPLIARLRTGPRLGHGIVVARCSSKGALVCLDPKSQNIEYVPRAQYGTYISSSHPGTYQFDGWFIKVKS